MMMPLVPPAAGSTAMRLGPALIQFTLASIVVAPRAVFHAGADPPVVPFFVTTSMLPLLSTMRFPFDLDVVAVQMARGLAESGP